MHAQRLRRYGDVQHVQLEVVKRINNRFAQLARFEEVKPTTYRKSFGRHAHRVIMEETVGRPLRSDEIVHHIDGNAQNNSPENLTIVTRAEHGRIHAAERWAK